MKMKASTKTVKRICLSMRRKFREANRLTWNEPYSKKWSDTYNSIKIELINLYDVVETPAAKRYIDYELRYLEITNESKLKYA